MLLGRSAEKSAARSARSAPFSDLGPEIVFRPRTAVYAARSVRRFGLRSEIPPNAILAEFVRASEALVSDVERAPRK